MARTFGRALGVLAAAAVAGSSLSGMSATADEAPSMESGAVKGALQTTQTARSAGGWTAEQMRSATPVKRTLSGKEHRKVQETKVDLGKKSTVPAVAPSQGAAEQACAIAPTSSGTLYQGCEQYGHYKQQGKMFFVDPRKPAGQNRFVCSATSISAGNKSTVLTAGHCLHQGSGGTSGGWFKDVIFVPAYKDGAAPYGQWKGVYGTTTNAWATSSNYAGDVAYFVVAKNAGTTLTDTVGSTGIGFGATHQGSQTYAFGYPAGAPYDGSDPYYCSGKSFAGLVAGTKGLNCRMTGGSSGGGWKVGLNVTTGAGTAISVNSYKNTLDVTRMYGPHFGGAAQEAHGLAAAYPAP